MTLLKATELYFGAKSERMAQDDTLAQVATL